MQERKWNGECRKKANESDVASMRRTKVPFVSSFWIKTKLKSEASEWMTGPADCMNENNEYQNEKGKKSSRITTKNVILILYRQFTSKAAKARYTLCPGNFRVCTMCRKGDFGAEIQQHIHMLAHMYMWAGERANRSIHTQMVPKIFNVDIWKLWPLPAINSLSRVYANTAAYTQIVHSRKIEQETKKQQPIAKRTK